MSSGVSAFSKTVPTGPPVDARNLSTGIDRNRLYDYTVSMRCASTLPTTSRAADMGSALDMGSAFVFCFFVPVKRQHVGRRLGCRLRRHLGGGKGTGGSGTGPILEGGKAAQLRYW
jgi:hypothetical protein